MAQINNSFAFEKAIQEAIQNRLNEIIEEESTIAIEKVKTRIKKEMPNIACALYKRFSIEVFREEMRITVSLTDNTEKK